MAMVELIPNRLRVYAHGPSWWSWYFGPEFGGPYVRLVLGPWEVELCWQRWSPWPEAEREQQEEVSASAGDDGGAEASGG